MTSKLYQLATDVVFFAGGAEKIFDLVVMAITPADPMGVQKYAQL
jgi:hypothetical protein